MSQSQTISQLSESKLDLIRTRKSEQLDQCTVVVDVGSVYDPDKLRFDHHQRGFTEIFGHGFTTKLSSAGLIYKYDYAFVYRVFLISNARHYGEEIIARRIKRDQNDPIVGLLHKKLYQVYMSNTIQWVSRSDKSSRHSSKALTGTTTEFLSTHQS